MADEIGREVKKQALLKSTTANIVEPATGIP
jgi:hypothetical protein